MTSAERVLAACRFERPDRIPRFEGFWDYPEEWEQRLGPQNQLNDVAIWVPDETTVPTQARHLKEDSGWIYEADGWGRTIRRQKDAYFVETLEVALPVGADVDALEFDPPELDSRYARGGKTPEEIAQRLREAKRKHCVFGKTGGPYLRTTFVRGETQFLMDIASDPELARAIADKVGDHLTAVGVEEIRRWSLQDTGIFIYDDMAYNSGPMFSPASFEKVFLPVYRRMVKAYRDAGAKYVCLHSDGDIRPVLDMLVDAGIDGLNPLEKRAGMDAVKLRERYPRLILTGGMCNTDTLVNGPKERIVAETKELIDLGRDGGVVIGTHSVSPEISLENYATYHDTCLSYGNFS